jgi:hypothetical protein
MRIVRVSTSVTVLRSGSGALYLMKPERMTAHLVGICARSQIRIRWINGYRAQALG